METSKEELLAELSTSPKGQPIPDELFYAIFETEDVVERTRFIEDARTAAGENGRTREFNNLFKAFVTDYIQKNKQTGNVTNFTQQPIQLSCGEWMTSDTGITRQKYDNNGNPYASSACNHPILPIQILKNIDTYAERVKLAYFKYGEWQHVTIDREVCAETKPFIRTVAGLGVDVTEDNAAELIRYIREVINMNPALLEPKKSISRLGWSGNEFSPYAEDIIYEGDPDYEVIYKNITQGGSFDAWLKLCREIRKDNIPLRLMMAASFASVLLEPLGVLPFVLHIWGPTGTCKTVALMVAMSIWGNPKMGALVKTMNMTKNSIMRNAAFLHSLPFAGDELQTIKDRWSGNFDQLIYQITEGVDRGRAKAYGGVEETKTWKNSTIFTGEEPITKADSGGGSKNRVIEVAIEDNLVKDGHMVSAAVAEHHGHAGRKFVETIMVSDKKELLERYKYYNDELCKLDTTDKQAMAMACILVADELAVKLFFPGETPLQIKEVKRYLQRAKDVDVAERAYQSVINWTARNPIRFEDPRGASSANKGEAWGRMDDGMITINRDVLVEFLHKNGFDYTAVSKKWAATDKILKNSQGKYIHSTKVYGIKASYVKLKLMADTKEEAAGFMVLDENEPQLPF